MCLSTLQGDSSQRVTEKPLQESLPGVSKFERTQQRRTSTFPARLQSKTQSSINIPANLKLNLKKLYMYLPNKQPCV